MAKLTISKGNPLPYGTSVDENGINFSLVSKSAETVSLMLFEPNERTAKHIIDLNPLENKSGWTWHVKIGNISDNLLYAWRLSPLNASSKTSTSLIDPYAKELSSTHVWGGNDSSYTPLGEIFLNDKTFDWEDDKSPVIKLEDLIIYEMHVRGFTIAESSKVNHRGSFLGIIEKIPHLIDLGINAVEFMPIFEFNENENKNTNPIDHTTLYNYWGYSTVNFFSPMKRYASNSRQGNATIEFKKLVKELHKHNIAVILDVVYNHSAEGNEQGPTLSFRGIDNAIWYMHDNNSKLLDFTGCGNTINCAHPHVQQMIIDSLRYWVQDMHVDGFRFDLASVFMRDQLTIQQNSSILERISQDPLLADKLLIAEPWDAAGLYQVGAFYYKKDRWSEWNGKWRDVIRKFINGTAISKGEFATRLSGSQDLYGNYRRPTSSINFVTCHDGFSLNDLVSYNHKHNDANGEKNKDGTNDNDSWNCGVEGKSTNKKVQTLRIKQMKNFHLALMVSQGIPMLLMGDEYGHTKNGNNNTYCHDNELNWFLWDQLESNNDFYRFYKLMIHFRKNHPILRNSNFLTDRDIIWHSTKAFDVCWEKNEPFLAFTLKDHQSHQDLFVAFNACGQAMQVEIPLPNEKFHWHILVNTANTSPEDFFEEDCAPLVALKTFKMQNHSALILKAR